MGSYRSYTTYNCKNETAINLSDGLLYFRNVFHNATSDCGDWQVAILDFDSSQYIDSSTKFNLGGYVVASGSLNDVLLVAKDTSGNNTCRWSIANRENDYTNTEMKWFCHNTGNSSGDVYNNTFLWDYYPEHDFNSTLTDLEYDFSTLPEKNLSKISQPYDQLYLFAWQNTGTTFDYLSTMGIPVNYLPSANISISNFSYCLINDTLDIPVNISASDPEGDVIYYATSNSVYGNISNQVDFTAQSCIIEACVDYPDYSVLKPLDNGECEINRKRAYNSSAHNLITRSDYFGNQVYMLELNSDCNREDKSFNYVLGSGTGLYSSFHVWDLADTEQLNFSYHRSDNYEFLKLQLIGNGSKADLYFNGTLIMTAHNPLNRDALDIRIQPQATSYQIVLSNGTFSSTYDITRDPFTENVQYFKLVPLGKVTLEQFFYQATVLVPDFSTTKPEYLTVTQAVGRDYYTIFLTDNIHLDSDFRTYTVPFNVYPSESCKYLSGEGIGQGDVTANVDILGVFKSFFGSSLKNYLLDLGYYEVGEKILWVIFFFMLLGLMFSGFMIFGHLSLTVPLFLSSICCGLIAFMVDYTPSLISFLIILALSLAVPLSKVFTGDR